MFVVAKEDDRFLWAACEHHKDTRPSLCINKVEHNNKPAGFFYCFSCGRSGQITESEVSALSKYDLSGKNVKARDIPINIDWLKLTCDYIGGRLRADYPGDLVSEGSACVFYTGWCDGCWTIPMKNECGEITGIQFRHRDGKKSCVEGSKLGIFIPYFPPPKDSQVVITEGFRDAAVAYRCGYYPVGRPSAQAGNEIIKNFLTNTLKCDIIKVVKIVSDTDVAGINGTNKLVNVLKDVCEVKVLLPIPYKDLFEYFEKEGLEKTKQFLGN